MGPKDEATKQGTNIK